MHRRRLMKSYALGALYRIAAKAAMTFKSPDYKGQQEWRSLVLSKDSSLVVVDDPPPRHVCVPLRSGGAFPILNAIHVGRAAPSDSEAYVESLLDLECPPEIRPPVRRFTGGV
jgi:hypothetical protein